jgi:hypothetical protein
VIGADHPEVAAVHRGDVADVPALGYGDDRRVYCPERQIAICGNELGDAEPIAGWHRLDREGATGEVAEEADLGLDTKPGRQQVGDFGDNEDRDDERARMALEQL